jgi:succinate dehydrogenase/fumarate reductase flavoprotein subunit
MKVEDSIKADVLCIGGGIAGLMAAIRASELGADVVVAEKGNTLTSGAGGIGNDHFLCYIPEVHGTDVMPVIEELRRGQLRARLKDTEKTRIWLEHTCDIVNLWDSWGIPMKYQGRYEFAGHAYPEDEYPCHLKYEGKKQKAVLTRQALKRGTKIINRVMVFELFRDNDIFVAIGLHTRTGQLIEFQAKSVILGTGTVARLYQGLTPGWLANATRPCTLTGDGRIMAYKAGAELFNVETLEHHAGPKYFTRSGQATWVGVVRDPQDKPIGPFLSAPDKRYSDMIIEVDKRLFSKYARSGKGPVYMDCRGISDEDYDYMMLWFQQEGFSALTDHLHDKGIDLRKNPIEWATYGMRGSCGSIWQDENGRTSLEGLYVAGDETTRSISPASTFGWIAGEHAANWVQQVDTGRSNRAKELIKEKNSLLKDMQQRETGPDWKEANIALQQIMSDYAGSIRSEPLLDAGYNHLKRLRKEAESSLIARTPHELSRALEVLNLMELGQLVCIAAKERKETRGQHNRTDYTYTNPVLDKYLVLKNVDGHPVTEWRR